MRVPLRRMRWSVENIARLRKAYFAGGFEGAAAEFPELHERQVRYALQRFEIPQLAERVRMVAW